MTCEAKTVRVMGNAQAYGRRIGRLTLARGLLNPNWIFLLHMDRVKGELRNVKFEGMDQGCLDTAITAVIESRALEIQDRYIDMALEVLLTEVPIKMSDVILPEGINCESGIVE